MNEPNEDKISCKIFNKNSSWSNIIIISPDIFKQDFLNLLCLKNGNYLIWWTGGSQIKPIFNVIYSLMDMNGNIITENKEIYTFNTPFGGCFEGVDSTFNDGSFVYFVYSKTQLGRV